MTKSYEFGPKTSVEFHKHTLRSVLSDRQTGVVHGDSGQEGGDWRDRNKTGLNTPLGIITGIHINANSKGLFHGGVV